MIQRSRDIEMMTEAYRQGHRESHRGRDMLEMCIAIETYRDI